ncbi:Uncharacterised protein [Mycobacteroides abscessus subsp. abscessus]|nr:Uncharacterised protein [Mycobacteroides abscessus subsp. abscessus]
MLALDVRVDALEAGGVAPLAAEAVAVGDLHLEVLAVQDRPAGLLRQLLPRGVQVEADLPAEPAEQTQPVLGGGLALGPRGDGPLPQGLLRVGDHQGLVDLQPGADAVALGTGAEGAVEGEGARLDLGLAQLVAVGAGEVLAVGAAARLGVLGLVHPVDGHSPLGQTQGGLDGVREPLVGGVLDGDAVHDHGDGVLVLLLQARRLGESDLLPVHHGPGVALLGQGGEQVLELALAGADHRGEDLQAGPLRAGHQLVHDLLRGLLLDRLPADRAVGVPDARPEQAHVIVDLGDGADRRAGVLGGGLLIDGHRRGQALDEVDVGLVHLAEEHPGVGGQGFDVAALALGEDGVEGQGGLAGAGQTGEHHHGVAGDPQVHGAQVVLPRPLDDDLGGVLGARGGRGGGGAHGCGRAPFRVGGGAVAGHSKIYSTAREAVRNDRRADFPHRRTHRPAPSAPHEPGRGRGVSEAHGRGSTGAEGRSRCACVTRVLRGRGRGALESCA